MDRLFQRAADTPNEFLDTLLGAEPVIIGDLILAEVLQGFCDDRDYRTAKALLTAVPCHDMLGAERAIQVADNYRVLSKKGATVCKNVDAVIATYCMTQNIPLLFSDRDFEPFVRHLGLRSAL